MSKPKAFVTAGRVETEDGRLAALLDLLPVGGGSQMVTVDGQPEERVHPSSKVWHVRLISMDPVVGDRIEDAGSFEEAAAIGEEYAVKLARAIAVSAEALGG